jgi:hypothetical protein
MGFIDRDRSTPTHEKRRGAPQNNWGLKDLLKVEGVGNFEKANDNIRELDANFSREKRD